jgi:hypothetical protein
MREDCANPGVAIGRDGDSDAAAADQHTPLRPARGNGVAHGLPEIRIIDGIGRIRAKIQHVVTRFLQVALQDFLKVEAGMIRRDRDGAPRHIDDRSPLSIEPPDTISGAAVSRSPKIVETDPQDIDLERKRPGGCRACLAQG